MYGVSRYFTHAKTLVIHMRHICNSIHMYHICRTKYVIDAYATHVIHLYFYTCNTPKTPHMCYRCCTTGRVL